MKKVFCRVNCKVGTCKFFANMFYMFSPHECHERNIMPNCMMKLPIAIAAVRNLATF